MKTRMGFVSNSSSSSYLIAVAKDAPKEAKIYLELFYDWLGKDSKLMEPEWFLNNTKQQINELNGELKVIKSLLLSVEKQKKDTRGAAAIERFFNLMDAYSELDKNRTLQYWSNIRNCYGNTTLYHIESKLKDRMGLIEKEIICEEAIAEKIRQNLDKQVLASFKIDNMETSKRNQIELLKELGLIEIIERINT